MRVSPSFNCSQPNCFFFFQAEDGIRDKLVTGVQTCALPICEAVARRVTVSAGEAPKRLDIFLSTHTAGLSRAAAQRLIEQGVVTVNGRPAKPSLKIKPGDAIEWDMPQPTPIEIVGEPIPLEILFEDVHLLILNKPAGLVAHPAPGHWSGTLVNALLHHFRTEGTGGAASIGGGQRAPPRPRPGQGPR